MVKNLESYINRFLDKINQIYHKYHIVADILFYVCLVIFVVVASVNDMERGCMLKVILNPVVRETVWIMDRKILPLLAILSLLFDFKDKKMRYVAFFSLFVILLYQVTFENEIVGLIPHCNVYLFGVACLVIAAKGRDFRKIGWVYVVAHATFMLLLTALALTGVVPDLIFEEVGRAGRHALGMHYPLNYAAHWFSIALVYCYLKNGFLRIWEYISLGALFAVSLFVCKAQTSTVLFALLIAGTLYRQIRYGAGKTGLIEPARVGKLIAGGLKYSFLILAIFMIVGSLLYVPPISTFLSRLTPIQTLFSRFDCARIGLMNYFPSALGIRYPTSTWNGTVRSDHYFFIDSSYVCVLLEQGVVIYLIMMAALWYVLHRMAKARQFYGLCLLALFAAICAMEHHILDVAFDPFLLMTFAAIENVGEKRSCRS